MWTCNICFKTFDRSTSYYNHRKSHKPNYEIDSSENETNSNEESSTEEFSLDSQMSLNEYISHPNFLTDINQVFETLNPTFSKDNNQSKDQSDNEQDFSNEFERPILEIVNPTFSENSDQSSNQSSIE